MSLPQKAIWSSRLWVPKSLFPKPPSHWAPEWEYEIKVLATSEGKMAQQQIAYLREQAIEDGEDPDEVAAQITDQDTLTLRAWSETADYWALSAGNEVKTRAKIKALGLEVEDRRTEVPWPEWTKDLVVLMTPRPHQVDPIEKWFQAGHGMLKANPAFGKTFAGISVLFRHRQMALVLTHTDALADQFLTRFRQGSPPQKGSTEFTPVTNCLDVEEATGKAAVGRYQSSHPTRIYPVTIATWQAFQGPAGRAALKALAKSFGVVLFDEGHVAAAPGPSRVVNTLWAKHKRSISATPDRKDGMSVLLFDTLGPVTAEGASAQVPIEASMIFTGCRYPPARYPRKGEWAYLLNWLVKQEVRNKQILKWLHHDYDHGRNILVMSDRVAWCHTMAEKCRQQGMEAVAITGGIKTKKGLAEREAAGQEMMKGNIRIIFATQVFKAGVDIPCLDTMYAVCPQNNEPQLEQMAGRIRRPYGRKVSCLFRYFVDEGHGLLYGCARGTQKALANLGAYVVAVPEEAEPQEVFSKTDQGFGRHKAKSQELLDTFFTKTKKDRANEQTYQRRRLGSPDRKPDP